MEEPRLEDAAIGMAQTLRSDREPTEKDGVHDRTAADVLRRQGFTPERIERWFGYVPEPMNRQDVRE